jgi:hypothetical protein
MNRMKLADFSRFCNKRKINYHREGFYDYVMSSPKHKNLSTLWDEYIGMVLDNLKNQG